MTFLSLDLLCNSYACSTNVCLSSVDLFMQQNCRFSWLCEYLYLIDLFTMDGLFQFLFCKEWNASSV